MGMMEQAAQQERDIPGGVSYYSLDYQLRGEQVFYIWRHRSSDERCIRNASLLIDLNNILIPENEIDKLVAGLDGDKGMVRAVAFFNCHSSNQRELKRRLKASDVRLFSKTAFFIDPLQARQWLQSRSVNC